MGHNIFPQVKKESFELGRASYEKKCIFHERLLFRYLIRKMEGWSVRNFLDMEGIGSYALYAVTDFATLFLKDLEQTGDTFASGVICDKNAGAFHFQFNQWSVILPDELIKRYKDGKIERIIVMSVLHENEIIDELIKEGILLNDIISFVSVLYS